MNLFKFAYSHSTTPSLAYGVHLTASALVTNRKESKFRFVIRTATSAAEQILTEQGLAGLYLSMSCIRGLCTCRGGGGVSGVCVKAVRQTKSRELWMYRMRKMSRV